jgi:hypothetical protein
LPFSFWEWRFGATDIMTDVRLRRLLKGHFKKRILEINLW